ncbi:MAG TPA: alpha/beta fold hydrolase [Pseudolabrys sp.]|nr:alpha/beta fold hydrolase [Pseudolabrys sp.]
MSALDAKSVTPHRMGSGAPLVLLHCLGVDHRFWDFATPLADRFTLLRYDLPGHGATPVPAAPYSIADLSGQLAAILELNGIGRASIAGISLGGLIAQHFAAHRPEMVERLVLVDTTPRYSDEIRGMWTVRAQTARTKGVAAMVPDLLKIWFSDDALARDPESVRYVRETLQRTSGEGYALACEALGAADLRPDAARIRAPTLVVCGENDIPSFLDSARWLAENIKGAKLVWIPRTRHASVIECPDQALKLLSDFLS